MPIRPAAAAALAHGSRVTSHGSRVTSHTGPQPRVLTLATRAREPLRCVASREEAGRAANCILSHERARPGLPRRSSPPHRWGPPPRRLRLLGSARRSRDTWEPRGASPQCEPGRRGPTHGAMRRDARYHRRGAFIYARGQTQRQLGSRGLFTDGPSAIREDRSIF